MHWFFKIFILEWNCTCFGQFLWPSSGVFHRAHSSGLFHAEIKQMGKITKQNSWWWTEELSETCRFSFHNKNLEKLVHLVGFIVRNLSRCTVTWMSTWFFHCNM